MMKRALVRYAISCATLGAILGWSSLAHAGDDGALMKQAEDLVKQAWNPGGDPPSKDQRTQLLNQAIELTLKEPDHRLAGARVQAVNLMKSALEEIKSGDPDNKVNGDLEAADRALRDGISSAESH